MRRRKRFASYHVRMRITVNGDAREYPDSVTVGSLLVALELASKPCAVEVNREVVPRRRHAEHALRDGDSIEIVTLVGGG